MRQFKPFSATNVESFTTHKCYSPWRVITLRCRDIKSLLRALWISEQFFSNFSMYIVQYEDRLQSKERGTGNNLQHFQHLHETKTHWHYKDSAATCRTSFWKNSAKPRLSNCTNHDLHKNWFDWTSSRPRWRGAIDTDFWNEKSGSTRKIGRNCWLAEDNNSYKQNGYSPQSCFYNTQEIS